MAGRSLPAAADKGQIPAMPPGVTVTTLDNGLVIIVREDHSAPVVSAQAWCKAGSIHEGRWLGAGLSHVLEHMLFKGTTTRGAGRIDQEVQEAGGYMNAYTSFDRTVYHIDVPNTGARVAIDILCDIMQHATLPEDELEKEKQVIRREMDMGQDDPGRRSSRRLFETAYTVSPYRFTIIGYLDIFNEITRDDVVGYYREKYVPNNVFYVVVGDVRASEVVDQIRACYEKSKARPMPPTVLPLEPRQTSARDVIEEAPIEMGHFHFSWHIPDVRDPDVPVLDVLATLLGMGRSSRLYQRVREKLGVVHRADAWTYSPGNPGLLGSSAMVDGDKFEAARDAILAEVERMKSELVSEAELEKARKQFIAGTLATRKTMQGQAQDLGGNWLAATDLNFSERYLAAVKNVTPADLQRVARAYLTAENRTLYALLPTGCAPRNQISLEESATHPVQKLELPNGLRLLIKEDHRLPFVHYRAVFKGGVLAENAQNNGITQMLGKMLLKGTKSRSAEDIATEIESVGGSIESYGGNNSFGVNAETLSSDLGIGLNLLADVILNPVFPEDRFEREREVQLAGIRAQRDHMLHSCYRLMRQTLFGATGYGLDAIGSEESVARLSTGALREFHRRMVVPVNCVLAIYGDVSAKEVKASIEKLLGHWQGAAPATATLPDVNLHGVKQANEKRDKKQAVLVMGFPGTRLDAPDRCTLELLSESCSDLGSRLFLRVREQLGLAYYVGAQSFAGLVPGYFAFYVGTAPEKVEQVREELLKEAELLRTEGLTAEELNRSKAKTIGQKKIYRQDLAHQAMTTALDELYGLGYEHSDHEDAEYEAVSLDDVKAAANKYLRPDAMVIAVVEPDGKPGEGE
ncbi:MAG: pitrilysin family protein [Verrucomicrobiota bacterium]